MSKIYKMNSHKNPTLIIHNCSWCHDYDEIEIKFLEKIDKRPLPYNEDFIIVSYRHDGHTRHIFLDNEYNYLGDIPIPTYDGRGWYPENESGKDRSFEKDWDIVSPAISEYPTPLAYVIGASIDKLYNENKIGRDENHLLSVVLKAMKKISLMGLVVASRVDDNKKYLRFNEYRTHRIIR